MAVRQLANLRDVGGLPARGGYRTVTGVLLRSDAPHPDDDPPTGVLWPPRTVLDLRSTGEIGESHPLRGIADEILAIPLAAGDDATEVVAGHDDLSALYLEILEHRGDRVAAAVRIIARSPGPLLVHCAAGKDRTGVVVAVVLTAIGVDRDAVVGDYHRTEANMDKVVERALDDRRGGRLVMEMILQRPMLVRAPRNAISRALDWVETQPGGPRGWLRQHGVDDSALKLLEQKLLT